MAQDHASCFPVKLWTQKYHFTYRLKDFQNMFSGILKGCHFAQVQIIATAFSDLKEGI